jgi:hypothetical protein
MAFCTSRHFPFIDPVIPFLPFCIFTNKTNCYVWSVFWSSEVNTFFGICFSSFLTYGGTETEVNGVIAIKDTASLETWYSPDIKSDTRLKRLDDNKVFEVMGEPEDIEYRHQFLKFKVEGLRGSRG